MTSAAVTNRNMTLKSDTLNKDLLPFSIGTDDYTTDLPKEFEESREGIPNSSRIVLLGGEAISERFQNRSI